VTRSASSSFVTPSPRRVKIVLIFCGLSVAAAVSASSTVSPGMNADTDLRTNERVVACSRRNVDVDIASSTFRITLIARLGSGRRRPAPLRP
jgi:hypothetical protein